MNSNANLLTRRMAVVLLAATSVVASSAQLRAERRPAITVYKDPSCTCCSAWVRHMSAAGFMITVIETDQVKAVKARLGVPDALASCHTAEISGYAIEGHVPAAAIMRLLAERPKARGLAVPGMPVGAPGMDGWSLQSYEVILFDGAVQRRYARYRGAREI